MAEELQVLFGDQKSVEYLIAAPLQKQTLPRKRIARLRNAGKPDLDDASDCGAELRGQSLRMGRLEPHTSDVGPKHAAS